MTKMMVTDEEDLKKGFKKLLDHLNLTGEK